MRRMIAVVVALVGVLAVPAMAAAQVPTRDSSGGDRYQLQSLISTPGVAGYEGPIRDAIRAALPDWAKSKARVDEMGSLIVTLGQGKPHVLICTDMDEDGFFISAITGDGYLRVHRVTSGVTNRLFEQMHYGQPIEILSGGKRVPGVFVAASTHLQRGSTAAATPKTIDDLWIDVGAQNKGEVAALGIHALDPVSLRERGAPFGSAKMPNAGVNAQGRAGVKAVLDVLARKTPPPVAGTITLAFVAQGTYGERGMARLALEFPDVDQIIVVARTPMPREGASPKGAIGQLGAGPVVVDTDAKTIDVAKQKGIGVQTIAGALRVPNVWPAARAEVIGLPVLYAQTPAETVDWRDIVALTDLLCTLAGWTSPDLTPAPVGAIRQLASPESLPDLRWLITLQAVSGAETPVRDEVLKQLPKWAKPEIDERGNVTVTFGQGGKEILFAAHMDEIGYEITSINDDGTAAVRKAGGFFDYLWEAHPVIVQTAKRPVFAVVAPRPNYLTATEAAPRAADVVLYFGTNTRAETEALGVAKGNTATIRKELTKLAGSRWTARAMDNRCGVATLLAALRQIVDPAKVPNRVTFAFTVGEETGLAGATFLAERLHPAIVFAVDTFVSSDSPVDSQRFALVPLGSGPVARVIDSSSIMPADVAARIIAIGKAHKVNVTPSVTSGGTDSSAFTKYGSIAAPLSWPGRYSHSPVEVMDLRDVEQLVTLVMALAREY